MRVVAGKYRGRNLVAPPGDEVRPTTTRIKETIFNILQADVPDCVALDLFAGSGALGIECLSRGAREVVFVDKSRRSLAAAEQNLKGMQGNVEILCSDALSALNSLALRDKKFDLIFLDPPYAGDLGGAAIERIISLGLLSEDGKIVFEHGSDRPYALPFAAYKQRTKVMGSVTCEFVARKHIALMTGSFDPVTKGHEQVLKEALATRFDEVVVACLVNPDKTYTFNNAQRLALAKAMCGSYDGARAIYSEKTAVEVAAEVGAEALLRGVRNIEDEGYEKDMADYNSERGFDTIFIELDEYRDISSTLVRSEIALGKFDNVPQACVPVLKSAEFQALQPLESK